MRTFFFSEPRSYASATDHSAFLDQPWRRRPRPNENCPLRIRWASSMPAIVMAALANDLNGSGGAGCAWARRQNNGRKGLLRIPACQLKADEETSSVRNRTEPFMESLTARFEEVSSDAPYCWRHMNNIQVIKRVAEGLLAVAATSVSGTSINDMAGLRFPIFARCADYLAGNPPDQ